MIELQKLQNDFESVLVHSQDYPFYLDSKNLIEQWAEAKKDIINLFGGELILRSKEPIKILLTEEQKNKRFEEFIQALDENGILTTDLELFLRDNKGGFFDNRVLLPYPSFNIPLGSKLSKSFKGIPLHESSVLVYSHMGAAFAAKQDSPSLAAVRVVVEIGKIGFPDYELFFGGGN